MQTGLRRLEGVSVLSTSFKLHFFYSFCVYVYVCECTRAMVHKRKLQDNLGESVLSVYHVGLRA